VSDEGGGVKVGGQRSPRGQQGSGSVRGKGVKGGQGVRGGRSRRLGEGRVRADFSLGRTDFQGSLLRRAGRLPVWKHQARRGALIACVVTFCCVTEFCLIYILLSVF